MQGTSRAVHQQLREPVVGANRCCRIVRTHPEAAGWKQ